MLSLQALRIAFPDLSATLFTESLGGAWRRSTPAPRGWRSCRFPAGRRPSSTANSSPASRSLPSWPRTIRSPQLGRPVTREDLEAHVQLVLTGRNAYAQSIRGGLVSPQLWRFVDQFVRLEFLLQGFGWCNMPLHMVEAPIREGRLHRLVIPHGEPPPEFTLYVCCPRERPLGPAGRWLVADLRERLKSCPASFPASIAAE